MATTSSRVEFVLVIEYGCLAIASPALHNGAQSDPEDCASKHLIPILMRHFASAIVTYLPLLRLFILIEAK